VCVCEGGRAVGVDDTHLDAEGLDVFADRTWWLCVFSGVQSSPLLLLLSSGSSSATLGRWDLAGAAVPR
jgi:hypothetical protein